MIIFDATILLDSAALVEDEGLHLPGADRDLLLRKYASGGPTSFEYAAMLRNVALSRCSSRQAQENNLLARKQLRSANVPV